MKPDEVARRLADYLRRLGYHKKLEGSLVKYLFRLLRPYLKWRPGMCMLEGLDSYEYTLHTGEALHFEVNEQRGVYRVHLDKISPFISPLEHLRRDVAPLWTLLLSVVGGLVVASLIYACTQKKDKALEGGFLAAPLFALLGLATAEWD